MQAVHDHFGPEAEEDGERECNDGDDGDEQISQADF